MYLTHHVFPSSLVRIDQRRSLLLVACENDSLIVYDWQQKRVLDELTDFSEHFNSLSIIDDGIAAGTRNGDLLFYRASE